MTTKFIPVLPEDMALLMQQAVDTGFSKTQSRNVVRDLQRTETERARLQRIVDEMHQSRMDLRSGLSEEMETLRRELQETKARLEMALSASGAG